MGQGNARNHHSVRYRPLGGSRSLRRKQDAARAVASRKLSTTPHVALDPPSGLAAFVGAVPSTAPSCRNAELAVLAVRKVAGAMPESTTLPRMSRDMPAPMPTSTAPGSQLTRKSGVLPSAPHQQPVPTAETRHPAPITNLLSHRSASLTANRAGMTAETGAGVSASLYEQPAQARPHTGRDRG
jgi:hypothetical protein